LLYLTVLYSSTSCTQLLLRQRKMMIIMMMTRMIATKYSRTLINAVECVEFFRIAEPRSIACVQLATERSGKGDGTIPRRRRIAKRHEHI